LAESDETMIQRVLAGTLVALVAMSPAPRAQQAAQQTDRPIASAAPALMLAPTNHPQLSLNPVQLWMAPDRSRTSGGSNALSAALAQFDHGQDAPALAGLSEASVQQGPLGSYALYYAARAQQRLGRHADAVRVFRLLQQREVIGYLQEAVALGEAESLVELGDPGSAADIYERVSRARPFALDQVLMQLGRTSEARGDGARAAEAYSRVFFEFPLTDLARDARSRLDVLPEFQPIAPGNQRFTLELGRAQRLYAAKMYGPAKSTFEGLRLVALPTGGDVKSEEARELIDLRIAQSDYYLKRYRPARDGLAPYIVKGSHRAEALYFDALASRSLGDSAGYLSRVRQVVDTYPDSTWAQEALNHLASQYVRQDADAAADTVFREIITRYPSGLYTERAAWKVGWRSYREHRYNETAEIFDRAAASFPRSDYRPGWLFWAGRSYEQMQRADQAGPRFMLVAADYLNTYYGRMSVEHLDGRLPAPRVIAPGGSATSGAQAVSPVTVQPAPLPPNEAVIRALLDIGRWDDALSELKWAQRNGNDSPSVQATMSYVYRQQGLAATGREQFNLLRGSITTMRRAYPQFMAAGGELLPRDVLAMIFPVSYWDLIQKHAAANSLDPYLIAALVAQESTFVPDVKSPANAVGLMQLIPSTARAYALKLGLKYSSKLMTDPEANVRMGTAYLSDKMKEFGDLHLALASYNAGERPVRRWIAERPDVSADEFIDDIPYPETQNYVKRILGTTEDYRRLYGDGNRIPRTRTEPVDAAPIELVASAAPSLAAAPVPSLPPVTAPPTPAPRTTKTQAKAPSSGAGATRSTTSAPKKKPAAPKAKSTATKAPATKSQPPASSASQTR